ASAPVSRLRSSQILAAPSDANFGIKGTLANYESSAVFGFEVPKRACGYNGRNFKSTALGRSLGVGPLVDELGHAGRHAVLAEFLEVNSVDVRILVLVFDLAAAVLDAHVHPQEDTAFVGGEWVAQAAEGDGEVACGIGRRVEVLVEHLVRRREHPAVPPVDAHEVFCALVPQQREAVPGDGEDVEVGS